MFNKLLRNLPFNPSLIQQVSFYAKRLRKEASIRRLGVIFVVLAMAVQLFAVIAPPQPSLAVSGNDLIPGGFTSQEAAIFLCTADSYGYGTILKNFYGITCGNVAAGTVQTIGSRDYGGQLYSMGRLPYGKVGEFAVTINGAGVFYMRPLWSWDTGAESHYTAVVGHNIFGVPFILLFNCGNLVIVGKPAPPVPPPPPPPTPIPTPCPYDSSLTADDSACKPCALSSDQTDTTACLQLSKTATNTTENITDANGTTAQPGDIINYTLTATNTGKGTIKGFVIEESLASDLQYANLIDLHGGTINAQDEASWPAVDLSPGASTSAYITTQVKNPVPQTPTSTSDPGSFNLTMTDVYGNTINIKVPGSIPKVTAQVTTALPNTGPGTSIFIGFVLTAIVGYFFARSRLMSKELDIVRKEYVVGGEV
jgi:uncharacterized repeat protein (TIGR01451 family)